MSFMNLPRPARLYVFFMILAGVAIGLIAAGEPMFRLPDVSLLIYVALALATSRMTVKIPFTSVHTSLDTAFVFVILMLYGLIPALVAEAMGQFILSVFNVPRKSYFKIPFNMGVGMVSVFGAYLAFELLIAGQPATSSSYVLPVIAMTLAYYLLNTSTITVAICLTEPQNIFTFWVKNFLPTGVGFISCASIATLLLIMDMQAGVLGFVVILPLVALLYFTQKVYLQKEEEALHHIGELENVLLTTMQSLALTIDAKDPYTHGHVHRVRHLAVGLAKKTGITDPAVLKGLSFAALVHDIGKIAIPDAILKKPGKYADQEFQIMKAHSILGAEMVKNLPLDFPVSKIVRHHHEKWNGRGYPDGLAGQQIPLESRIITVVDIFDAICSDRPYRPKMERNKVIEIMESEKGVSIDPQLAAVFLQHLPELERDIEMVDSRILDIVKTTNLAPEMFIDPMPARAEKLAHREMRLYNSLFESCSGAPDLATVLSGIAASVSQSVPYSAMALYVPDSSGDSLRPAHVDGLDIDFLRDNSVPVGGGASGWAHQHRRSLIVAPPEQEFSDWGKAAVKYLSCLAAPLCILDKSRGVLTLYSTNKDAFAGEDLMLVEKMIPLITTLVASYLDMPAAALNNADDPAENGEGGKVARLRLAVP